MIIKYIPSTIKLILIKIRFASRISMKSYFQYLGHNLDIYVSNGSTLLLGNKNYFDDYLRIGVHNKSKMVLGSNNYFNRNIIIECLEGNVIGDNCLFGPNVVIVDHDHNYMNPDIPICKQGFLTGSITIGSDVWVGSNVTICKGITICDHVIIGANSVVKHCIDEPGIYAGIPARKIKALTKSSYLDEKNRGKNYEDNCSNAH